MRLTDAEFARLPGAAAIDRAPIPPALREPMSLDVSERDYQARIVAVATLRGWRHYHTHDSRRSPAGFPDLVLVRGGQILFRELKTERGRLAAAQREWIDALAAAGADVDVWRPRHWGTVLTVLA